MLNIFLCSSAATLLLLIRVIIASCCDELEDWLLLAILIIGGAIFDSDFYVDYYLEALCHLCLLRYYFGIKDLLADAYAYFKNHYFIGEMLNVVIAQNNNSR